jgi:hypothetical protein
MANPLLADGVVDELKIGVLAHDIGVLGDSVEGGADIVGEVYRPNSSVSLERPAQPSVAQSTLAARPTTSIST